MDLAHVARTGAAVVGAPGQDQIVLGPTGHMERAARHLVGPIGPVISVPLDGMTRLWPAIRAVHHAHEVGGRGHQPELDRTVVEGPHADPVGVPIVPEVEVLAVLQHEVNGDRGARALRIQDPLDPELDVVRGERAAVRPPQAVAEVEHVPQAVVRDLPSLGEGRNDRPFRPLLDQAIEQLHAELDVRPRDGRLRIRVVGQEARGHSQGCGRRCRPGLGRRPQLEGPLVGGVGFGEPQRAMQGQSQFEQHQRHRLPFPPALQERQQSPVMADGLVEGVLLASLVARPGQVGDGLVFVIGGEPVVGQEPGDLLLVAGVPALEPLGRLAVKGVPRPGHDGAVDGLLDERVLEAVFGLGPSPALPDQVQSLELAQGLP